jgi:hypothetical protein
MVEGWGLRLAFTFSALILKAFWKKSCSLTFNNECLLIAAAKGRIPGRLLQDAPDKQRHLYMQNSFE